jgi:hypothetical protein
MTEQESFIDVSLPSLTKKPRQIFVAYSYRLYDERDYRRCFTTIGKAFQIEFVFADERISSLHILQKIANYIRESQFGIYDITGWNPNVTLELGLALGMGEKVFIALNPDETELNDVPSDLKGVDRLQYSSFADLEDELERLVSQAMPPPRDPEAENFLLRLQDRVVETVNKSPGISVSTIAKAVGVNIDLARLAARNELDIRLRTEGYTRGTKYFPIDSTDSLRG